MNINLTDAIYAIDSKAETVKSDIERLEPLLAFLKNKEKEMASKREKILSTRDGVNRRLVNKGEANQVIKSIFPYEVKK